MGTNSSCKLFPFQQVFGAPLTVRSSWRTAFIGLTSISSSQPRRRQEPRLERFLSDPATTGLLVRPFNCFSPPSSQTKAAFETRTAAINVTPAKQSNYNIDEIKADALWLSQQVNIDEVSALRIVLLEWQSRPADQLLSGFTDEEAISLQEATGETSLASSLFLPTASIQLAPSRSQKSDHAAFKSLDRRRLRILAYYLSERRYILKVSEALVHDGLLEGQASPTWTELVGKTIINARSSQSNAAASRKEFAVECVEALQNRVEALEKGSGCFNDDPRPEVEADWSQNMVLELVHILQLIFLVIQNADRIPTSSVVLAWLRFATKYAFFDRFDPQDEQQRISVPPLKSLVALVTLSMLKLPLSLAHLVESTEPRRLAPPSSETPFIADPSVFEEMNNIFLEAAAACLTTASPAVFAWGIILQTMRDVVMSRKEDKELRQSQRAVESFAELESSETEGGDSSNTEIGTGWRPSPRPANRLSTGSDGSMDPSMYDEVIETIMDSSSDTDPIGYMAKSAVNGSHVFDVIHSLATDFSTPFGFMANGEHHMGLRTRLVLLELIRSSLEWVEYLPEVVSSTLAVLTGRETSEALMDDSMNTPTTSHSLDLASFFLRDDVLLVPKLLDAAYARFPYEPLPFLKFVAALGKGQKTNDGSTPPILLVLEKMSAFTQVLPLGFREYDLVREEENANHIVLTTDLELFTARKPHHSLLLQSNQNANSMILADNVGMGDGVLIPAGTRGRVLQETNPTVVQWEYRYSGLKYLGTLLQCALPNSELVDSATGRATDRDLVTDIISAFTTLLALDNAEGAQKALAEASDGLERNRDVVTVIFDLFESELLQEQFQSGDSASTDLLVSCIHFILALIPLLPGKVWPLLARSALLEIDGNGGKMAAVVASTEMVTGHFDFLIGCIRVFGALVEDAVTNAIPRTSKKKVVGRFIEPEERGTGVPDKIMKKVLLAFARTMVDVLESSRHWRFAVLDQRLEVQTKIAQVFDSILHHSYGIDDTTDTDRKVTGTLAPATAYLVDVFLSKSSDNLPMLSILRVLYEGVSTPDTTLFFFTLRHWISQVKAMLSFCTTLVRVRDLLALPFSHLEGQLFKAAPLIARIYAAHEAYRLLAIELLEAMTMSAASSDGLPPPLVGHLGPESAKTFLVLLSQFDGPQDDDDLDIAIWNLLSAVVSNGQQWLSIYLLTGNTPRDSLAKRGVDRGSHTRSKPFLAMALDAMTDIQNMPPSCALAMLEFIVLAENHWPWAMSDLRNHSTFISSISIFVGSLKADKDVNSPRPSVGIPSKIRMASFTAEILAMYIHYGRQSGNGSFSKKLLPGLTYFFDKAVMVPGYNTSLHANLRRNFEDRFPGCTLSNFKHTKLRRRQFGPDYFYNMEIAGEMLRFDKSWNGRGDSGLAGEFERANVNLSLVESQIVSAVHEVLPVRILIRLQFLLHSWKFLAIELSNGLSNDVGLQKSMAKVVKDCLMSNAASNLPEAIFTRLVQVRGDFAFVLMQKLAEVKSTEPEVKALLHTTWNNIRSSGANFELALSSGDTAYYRSMLKILFLSLRAHLSPLSATSAQNKPQAQSQPHTLRTPTDILETVLAILDLVVARGFRDLAAAVHERPAESSPEDIALVTAILQTCLHIPGIEAFYPQICSNIADAGTPRVATTLFSWSDQLAVDGDPVYGELAILLLVELSSVPAMAEQLAVDGVLTQLLSARLMKAFRRGVSALDANQRLYSIWTRGILPLTLNLLSAIGPAIAPEITYFLNQYSAQLSLASSSFHNDRRSVSKTPPAHTLAMASEAHSLALLHRILAGFRAAGASTGVLPAEIPPLQWDASAVKEDVEYWLRARAPLRERLVPMSETERDMAREKPRSGTGGIEHRLEEKVVSELLGVTRLLN